MSVQLYVILLLLCFALGECMPMGKRQEQKHKKLPSKQLLTCVKCVSAGKQCAKNLANRCGKCFPSVHFFSQPKACHKITCHYCNQKNRRRKNICNSIKWGNVCSFVKQSEKLISKRPLIRMGKGCTWNAHNDAIVIPLARVPNRGTGWTFIRRDGLDGLIYEKNLGMGIDNPGKKGLMCFPVRAWSDGSYYMSAVSYAPHVTEHNDVWVQSSKPIGLWQGGRLWRTARNWEWLKAYQNDVGWSIDFKTKDFDGHQFVIKDVGANEKFFVCLSGRSYKYEMYRLVIAKCKGGSCNGNVMGGIRNFEESRCV